MTVAIVTLAAVVALALGVIVWLARQRSALFDDLTAAVEDRLMFEARAEDMAEARDEARGDAAKFQTEATAARAAFITSQAAERAAREEKANALAAIARSATSDDLFRLAGELLGKALPGAPAAAATRADPGDTAPLAAVRPADAAAADGADAGPGGG